jgi:hypothetical protein
MTPKNTSVGINDNNKIDLPKDSHINKQLYLRPILIKYGHLAFFTAGGTRSRAEGSHTGDLTRRS